jgi:hypothetical protein
VESHPQDDFKGLMLVRICSEYLEVPGLCLTRAQAQRLWGIDEDTCADLLGVLLEAGFLRCTGEGQYVRVIDGAIPSLRVRAAQP